MLGTTRSPCTADSAFISRSRRPTGRWCRSAIILCVLLVMEASAWARPDRGNGLRDFLLTQVTERLNTATRAVTMIEEKIQRSRAVLRARLQALAGVAREAARKRWGDRDERARSRVAAGHGRRVVARDLIELRVLRRELQHAAEARLQWQSLTKLVAAIRLPERRSLARPVAGRIVGRFGQYRDRKTKLSLVRRGLELRTRPGRSVRAPAAGIVKWVGPMRRLDTTVVIAHDGFVTVLGGLNAVHVKPGEKILSAQVLGTSKRRRMYFEVRIDLGPAGIPVDPRPLLQRR